MKVLVCCVPQAGHVNPMLPLIKAMVAAGDTVVVATGEDFREVVEGTGASWRNAGSSISEWFGRMRQRTRGAPGDGLPPERVQHYFLPRLFAEVIADDMVDDVLTAARELQPDLLIHDALTFAGPLAADVLGVPSAQHLVGALPDLDVLQLCADAVSPLWRTFDRDVPAYGGVFRGDTIAICPPSLDDASVPSGRRLALRPAPLPARVPKPQEPPLVYVTLGTLWADPTLLRSVIEALEDHDAEAVVTTGQLDPGDLGALPRNVRAERFIPQQELLPGCALVVHHAGAGTMFGALAHGLPQVALPQAADNFVNARRLAEAGAALTLMPDEVSPDSLGSAIRQVLDEPAFSQQAARLAAEIAAMPAPDELAARLRTEV